MKNLICYNCSITLLRKKIAKRISPYPLDGEAKEHIPAECLFRDFGREFKLNIITIPACSKCNSDFGKDEEEFRNALAIIGQDNPNLSPILDKTLKSLEISKALQKGRFTYENGQLETISFENRMFFNVYRKYFRGLFYYQYDQVLPQSFDVVILPFVNSNTESNDGKLFYKWLQQFPWKTSGHPEIFRYIIQPFVTKVPLDGSDIPFTEATPMILATLTFYDRYTIILGAKNSE